MSASDRTDRTTLKRLLQVALHQVGAVIAGFVVFPVIARMLDDDHLGAWALLGAVAFLMGLADLGLSTAVQRSAVTADHARTRSLIALSVLTQLALFPVVAAVALLFLLDLPDAPAAVLADLSRAKWVALAGGAIMALTQPYRMFVLARGNPTVLAKVRSLGSVLQVAIVIVGFQWFRTLLVPAFALLASYAVEYILTLRAARAFDATLPILPRWPASMAECKTAFRDGAAAFGINAAVTTALRVDLFVLAGAAPLTVLAAYGVAGRAVDVAYLFAKQTVVVLMPELGDPARRKQALRLGTGVLCGLTLSGMAALALNGQQLLILWVGDVAAGSTPALVLGLLAIASALLAVYEVASSMVMLGSATAWACAIPILIGSGVNLAISITGAPYYGVWAVAGSTIVGNTVTMILMWRAARRIVSWSRLRVAATLAPGLAAASVSTGMGLVLASFSATGPLASAVCCVITTTAGATAAAAIMRYSKKGICY